MINNLVAEVDFGTTRRGSLFMSSYGHADAVRCLGGPGPARRRVSMVGLRLPEMLQFITITVA